LILIDSYGWIEYFAEGPLADTYATLLPIFTNRLNR